MSATDQNGGEYDRLVRAPVGTVQPIRDVDDVFVFRFEMGPAILAQLLERLKMVPLTPILDCLDAKYPGFYHIHYRGAPVYIGKSSRPVGTRLKEHVGKLSGRLDRKMGGALDLAEIRVRYVFVEDESLVDLSESALVNFFESNDLAAWSGTGYGSKVAGAGRKAQQRSKWEVQFPPDKTVLIEAGSEKPMTLKGLIGAVKRGSATGLFIPKKVAERFRKDHPERMTFPKQAMTFADWVEEIRVHLKEGWILEETETGWYVTYLPSK